MNRISQWFLGRRICREDRRRCSYGLTTLRENRWHSDLIPDTRVYDRTRRGFTKAGGR